MEDDSENDIIVPSQYNLPEAPKALVNEIDPTQIPSAPPFKVHLRNLHYELEKEDLEGLFRNLTVSAMNFFFNLLIYSFPSEDCRHTNDQRSYRTYSMDRI